MTKEAFIEKTFCRPGDMPGGCPSNLMAEEAASILSSTRRRWEELAAVISGQGRICVVSGRGLPYANASIELGTLLRLEPPRTEIEAYMMLIRELPATDRQAREAVAWMNNSTSNRLGLYRNALEQLKKGQLPHFLQRPVNEKSAVLTYKWLQGLGDKIGFVGCMYKAILLQLPREKQHGLTLIYSGNGDCFAVKETPEGFGWIKSC